ncbi:MAG: efflux RND transporter periplasmic adaptor subunit [Fibrobacteres bacterium]|nr:efflux RND transporter periplasmic adaptor subunit [Fibrobacterota bacterium]
MKLSVIALSILLITLSGCNTKKETEKAPGARGKNSPPVIGFVVTPSLLKQEIEVGGTLKALEEVLLMPETQGRVVSINIPEGRAVKKGTLLVKLYDGELQATKKKLEALLVTRESALQRLVELHKANSVSSATLETSAYERDATKADLDAVLAQISKTEIRAPFDGEVGLSNINVGAGVTPSTPITWIRSVSRLKLDFSLPERESALLRVGQKVEFRLGDGNKVYSANVIAAEPAIDASTRNRKFRASVMKTDGALVSGAFVTVHAALKEEKGALLIPTQCILPQGDKQLVVLNRKGKAELVPVITGIRQPAKIQIISGLKPNDTIAASGLQFIKPGMPLKFIKFLNTTP